MRNGEKLKDFKLNMISDQKCTQEEFDKLVKDNKKLTINHEFINQMRHQFSDAMKFQQDRDEVKRLLHKQTYDRIKHGNYRGLNLMDIKINLQGEIAIAEQVLQMAIAEGAKTTDRNELQGKLAEL